MADVPFYLPFAITLLACTALFVICRRRLRAAPSRSCSAATLFTIGAPAIGLLSGVVALPAFTNGFLLLGWIGAEAPYGHGEALIAAPAFNAALGTILAPLGRIFLPWRPISS